VHCHMAMTDEDYQRDRDDTTSVGRGRWAATVENIVNEGGRRAAVVTSNTSIPSSAIRRCLWPMCTVSLFALCVGGKETIVKPWLALCKPTTFWSVRCFGIHERDGGKIYANFANATASPPACVMPSCQENVPIPF